MHPDAAVRSALNGCKYLPSGQKFESKLCILPQLFNDMKNSFRSDNETDLYFNILKILVNNAYSGLVASRL